jgi:hypothetical protein
VGVEEVGLSKNFWLQKVALNNNLNKMKKDVHHVQLNT